MLFRSKELFGGGKGTLELTEDEDVLESGVRIIAQPPGKKLQNMNLLSGGEKMGELTREQATPEAVMAMAVAN